jgi:dihydrofolate reductase
MRKVKVVNHMSLDGVYQSPADPEEDTRGGFEHGGWAAANNDEVMAGKMAEHMSGGGPGALLLGRRTYEHFYGFWPHQTDNPFTEVLNRSQKYVASTTLSEPLPWENSTLLKGDVAQAVAELKQQDGPDFVVLGSGELIHTLMEHDLIDEFLLQIHPVVLGNGLRMFDDGAPRANLKLTDSVVTTTGVVIATYERAR